MRYSSNQKTTSNNDAKTTAEMGHLAFVFGIDVGGIKRPNATSGSMVTSAITFSRFGNNKIGFGSNLTLIYHVSSVCYCGPLRLCARHQAYITDIMAFTVVI